MENKDYFNDIIAFLERRAEDISDFDSFEEYLETEDGKETFERVSKIWAILKKDAHDIFDNKLLENLGKQSFIKRDFTNAIEYYDIILKVSPDNINCLVMLAMSYQGNKQYDHAEMYFKKALDIQPRHLQALAGLGYIFNVIAGKQEDKDKEFEYYKKAVEYLEKAIELDINYSMVLSQLGFAYLRTDQYERAEKYLKRYLLSNPKDTTILHWLEASQTFSQKYNEAISTIEKGIEIEKDSPHYHDNLSYSSVFHNNLAYNYSQLGNAHKAKEHITKAVELAPESDRFSYNYDIIFENAVGELRYCM